MLGETCIPSRIFLKVNISFQTTLTHIYTNVYNWNVLVCNAFYNGEYSDLKISARTLN